MNRSFVHNTLVFVLAAALAGCAAEPQPAAPAAPGVPAQGAVSTPALSNTQGEQPRLPTFMLGNGQFIAKPHEPPADTAAADKGVQLSFVETDIRSVLSNILGDALGLSYTIDPSIKGTLTVQSARPLAKDDLLRALEAALALQDIALVAHADGSYDVVPLKDAQKRISSVRLPDSAGAPGFGVQIVPLRYTSAEEMSRLLEPFAPPGAVVRVDNARNLLVLAGTSRELASLLDVVQTFDVDWLSGMSYAFFPTEYADAKTVAEELKQVFDEQKSPLGGMVRLIPLPRLNTILVASPQPEYLQKVGDWIKRLDLGSSSPGRRIYVYDVQNGKCTDLATTLSQVFGIEDAGSRTQSTTGSGTSSGMQLANGLGGGGAAMSSSQGIYTQAAGGLAFPAAQGSTRQPYQQQYAAPFGAGGYGAAGPVSLDSAGLRVVPDEATNALLILATPNEFGVIENALKRLDVPPRQVLIEASLAEVTLNDEIKFGVEWAFKSSNASVGYSPNSGGSIASLFPGFSYMYTGAGNISAVLNALESITKVKVLSAPKLLVLNNHEADIEVGDEVPILTQQAVSTSQTGAPIVNSVDQRETGVILHVTPRVNQSGMVILDIGQEVSSVVPTTTSSIDSPTIQERKITSTVAVRDGETIALGGMISDSRSTDQSGLPWLLRIPVFSWLFGTTDKTHTRTELIVLLKPRVIRDSSELGRVMDDLHEEFRSAEQVAGQPPAHAPPH